MNIQRKDYKAALRALDKWDQRFRDQPKHKVGGMAYRIVALAGDGQVDEFRKVTENLMKDDPASAIAAIDDVLTKLDARVEEFRRLLQTTADPERKTAIQAESKSLVDAAEYAAAVLKTWSEKTPLDEQLRVLGVAPSNKAYIEALRDGYNWRIPMAQALLVSQRYEEARKTLEPLAEKKQYANEKYLYLTGEIHFMLGSAEYYKIANTAFSSLIRNIKRDPKTNQYPQVYWHAWMRMCEIVDKTNGSPQKIMEYYERLNALNANLGGQPYQDAIMAMWNKARLAAPAAATPAKREEKPKSGPGVAIYIVAFALLGLMLILMALLFIRRMQEHNRLAAKRARLRAAAPRQE